MLNWLMRSIEKKVVARLLVKLNLIEKEVREKIYQDIYLQWSDVHDIISYINSEKFVDDVVTRLKRKQLK